MDLTEKDLHCIARLLQGVQYEDDRLFCCRGYCRYSGECAADIQNHRRFQYNILREHLEAATGVYLGFLTNPDYVYRQMTKDSYFEANGIDPFKDDLEINCPKYAMDWIHAKGVKEKAARFRSMLKIKRKRTVCVVKAIKCYWKSLIVCKIKKLIYRLEKRRQVK